MFTFVHVADIHLGLGFRNVIADADTNLSDCAYAALRRVTQLCTERKAAFLLLAGDLYDTTRAHESALTAQLALVDEFNTLHDAGIRTFMIHGNHDPLTRWTRGIQLPELTTRFTDQTGPVEFTVGKHNQRVRVFGQSYAERATQADPQALRNALPCDGAFNIALLHCTVTGTEDEHAPYANIAKEDLETCGADYCALGHVHTARVLCEANPRIAYAGTLQPASIRDSGPGGAWVVTVDDNNKILPPEYVPLAVARWATLDVDVSGCETIDDMPVAVAEACAKVEQRFVDEAQGGELPKYGIVRLKLVGRCRFMKDTRQKEFDNKLHTTLSRALSERQRIQGVSPMGFYLEKHRVAVVPALAYTWQERPAQDDFLDKVFALAKERIAQIHELNESPPDYSQWLAVAGSRKVINWAHFDSPEDVHSALPEIFEQAAAMILDAMETPQEGDTR